MNRRTSFDDSLQMILDQSLENDLLQILLQPRSSLTTTSRLATSTLARHECRNPLALLGQSLENAFEISGVGDSVLGARGELRGEEESFGRVERDGSGEKRDGEDLLVGCRGEGRQEGEEGLDERPWNLGSGSTSVVGSWRELRSEISVMNDTRKGTNPHLSWLIVLMKQVDSRWEMVSSCTTECRKMSSPRSLKESRSERRFRAIMTTRLTRWRVRRNS